MTCSAGDVTPVWFLLDEMLSPQIAGQLHSRGIDAEAVAARPDLVGRADDHVLAVAQSRHQLRQDVASQLVAVGVPQQNHPLCLAE